MTTISASIFNILAEEIVNGTLKPGTKLEEIPLATRFNVSRTPIREVLRNLASKGLVQLLPRRGVVVAQIGVDELSDMLEAECELEALCAQIAAHRMSLLEKKKLEYVHELANIAVKKGDEVRYLELNHEFHNLIAAGTHNKLIAQTVGNLRDRLSGFRQAQSKTEKRLPTSHTEHQSIVDAILNSDAPLAFQKMRDHNARLSSKVIEQLSIPSSSKRIKKIEK
jgi:DNA-binding GntR family transcriptional regulator